MPFISTLDVINAMLSTLGEAPLNTVDESHPLVAAGLSKLATANLREQAKSWWFNKELMVLAPDAATGNIFVPDDSIRVDPTFKTLNYTQRGRRLYNNYSNGSSDPYVFTSPVQVWLIRCLPFEDLPPDAAALISWSAQMDFQNAFDGDAKKFAILQGFYGEALKQLNAEHTRNVQANLFDRVGVVTTMNRLTPRLAGLNDRYSNF